MGKESNDEMCNNNQIKIILKENSSSVLCGILTTQSSQSSRFLWLTIPAFCQIQSAAGTKNTTQIFIMALKVTHQAFNCSLCFVTHYNLSSPWMLLKKKNKCGLENGGGEKRQTRAEKNREGCSYEFDSINLLLLLKRGSVMQGWWQLMVVDWKTWFF